MPLCQFRRGRNMRYIPVGIGIPVVAIGGLVQRLQGVKVRPEPFVYAVSTLPVGDGLQPGLKRRVQRGAQTLAVKIEFAQITQVHQTQRQHASQRIGVKPKPFQLG